MNDETIAVGDHQSSYVVYHPDVWRLAVEIRGAVQGVGFRPFVYRLATDLRLAGWVLNDARGVFIEIEGPPPVLDSFLARLPAECPPRALIQSIEHRWLAPAGYQTFAIRQSNAGGARTAVVLPDLATCPDCLAELRAAGDRRHRYAFTNCTNCGPRFTIVEALPYDRPNTTMHSFTMCPACRAEYDHPRDRRFHAQPNACPACGPHLELWARDEPRVDCDKETRRQEDEKATWRVGLPVSLSPGLLVSHGGDAALRAAAAALRAGQIVAVKGMGGFQLMVDARNAAAVARLRERKLRPAKPFALMARDLDQAGEICEVSPAAAELLSSPAAPIVLLPRRAIPAAENTERGELRSEWHDGQRDGSATATVETRAPAVPAVAEEVAPENPYLGVMLPCTPLHHLLLGELDFPVVATSGNLSDEPICIDEGEAVRRLGHVADAFLVHNRPIARHADDSIVAVMAGAPRIVRRARGYAPLPVTLAYEAPAMLAVGAHLKNTIALSVGRQVFISQHIGDLETPEAMAAFEQVIADFLRLYQATPIAIAHDMHPEYLSTKWAIERTESREQKTDRDDRRSADPFCSLLSAPCSLVPVQHHHAHFAACLAEHGVDGPALGVIWDGAGYGHDGAIWGGEFLRGGLADSQRAGHLRPFRLPGGDAAAREPRRVAMALLWDLYGPAAFDYDTLEPVRSFQPTERRLIGRMIERGVNAVPTTSAGRLFDGVAALLGLHQRITYEGQAAMALEWLADPAVRDAYPFELTRMADNRRQTTSNRQNGHAPPSAGAEQPPMIIDWRPTLDVLLADLRRGVARGIIAARFHNAMVEAIVAVAVAVGEARVALSGGCFQNRILVERVARRLADAGFEVLLHRQVPTNDGGISFGQVAAAAAQLAR